MIPKSGYGFRIRSCLDDKLERDDGSGKRGHVQRPSTDRVAGFAFARTPQRRAGPFAVVGALCVDGGGPICWGGGGGGEVRAAARGGGFRCAAGAAGGAGLV